MDEYFYSNIRSIRFTPTLERIQLPRARCAASLHHLSPLNLSKSCPLKILGWSILAWRRQRSKHLASLSTPWSSSSLSQASLCFLSLFFYGLRNLCSFEVPVCSSSFHSSSFLPSCIILWNSLSASFTSCSSLSSFASSIDLHFAFTKFSFGRFR